MLNNITLGKYYAVDSLIHRINPITKTICTILFIISVFFANNLTLNVCLLVLMLLMMSLSKVPMAVYFKTIFSLKWLMVILFLVNYLTGVSLQMSVFILVRLVFVVLYTAILTLTTAPTEITYGLEKVFFPLKLIGIPVNKMALSISIALRFIPTIIDQSNRILKSQASRGIDYYNSKINGKFMALKAMIIPMFNLSIKRADELADAMEVRLFSIKGKRTNYRINKFGLFDVIIILVHISILCLAALKGVII